MNIIILLGQDNEVLSKINPELFMRMYVVCILFFYKTTEFNYLLNKIKHILRFKKSS